MPVAGSSILARFIKLIAYAEQKAGSLGPNTDVNMAVNVFGRATEFIIIMNTCPLDKLMTKHTESM